jgi:hypothetical protein
MKGHRLRAAGVVAAVAATFVLTVAAPAGASSVTEWNLNATNALIGTAAQAPPVTMLHLAMVHGAVYDAVNAIHGGYTPYLVKPAANFGASIDAAVATAAHDVLVSIVPGQAATLDGLLATSLMGIPDGPKADGIAVGSAAAAAMIAARTGDGRFGAPGFPIGFGPGQWRPTPPGVNDPNGWIRDVKTFIVKSSEQFATNGPYALKSPHYTRDFNEVKKVGSASAPLTDRSADQTQAAQYWALHAGATWSRITRNLDGQAGLSAVDAARLYAQIYLTAADAAITIWDDKARWGFWRPYTAIREAATDGNPNTTEDTGWTPLIVNPPYPEHPSGHLGLSSSFVETLKQFFGTDSLSWTDSNAAGSRSFTSLSAALTEIVNARVWSGIHFRHADVDSAGIGKKIADWRKAHYFKKRP